MYRSLVVLRVSIYLPVEVWSYSVVFSDLDYLTGTE
nr:MAG TPA: hypothetical protein [Caudoviricetes sp.]DAY88609.1 MAG TPA: hypothetical protein [Caudoviricetes sp.]